MYRLEELQVYNIAKKFRKKIATSLKTFPKEEQYLICNQLKRSSRSVAANIAEGYGRFHYQENIQFCRQVRGSLFETYDHLSVCKEEGFISEDLYLELKGDCEHLLKLLNGYIAFLKQQKTNNSIS